MIYNFAFDKLVQVKGNLCAQYNEATQRGNTTRQHNEATQRGNTCYGWHSIHTMVGYIVTRLYCNYYIVKKNIVVTVGILIL